MWDSEKGQWRVTSGCLAGMKTDGRGDTVVMCLFRER